MIRPVCLALTLAAGAIVPRPLEAATGDPVPASSAFADLAPRTADLAVHLRRLTGEASLPGGGAPILSRSVLHPDLGRAERYVRDELAAMRGLTTETRCLDAIVTLDAGPVVAEDVCTVIAELPGLDPALSPLVLGAHLDSTGKASPQGWDAFSDPAPGADDDASGVSAVLVIARALSERGHFRRTVRFVLFTAEEVGLQGSAAYVDQLTLSGEDVALMLQLDPVGYNGAGLDRLWFAYDDRWPELPGRVDAAADELGSWLSVQGVSEALIGGDARSDHYPFWLAGLPALHFGAFPPPPDYHKTTDTMEVVDLEFLAEVTRVVLRVMVSVIDPVEPPPVEEPTPVGSGCAGSVASHPVPSLRSLPGNLLVATLLGVTLARRGRGAR